MNNNNNNKNKKKNNDHKSGKSGPLVRLTSEALANVRIPIPKDLRLASPIPRRIASTLKLYYKTVLQDAINSFASIVLKANDWWSPNVALGIVPGSLTGFDMLTRGYMVWLVDRIRFRYSVTSNEPSHGMSFAAGLSDTVPVITTLAQAQSLLGREPVTRVDVVGQTTGSSVFMSKWYDIMLAAVVASPVVYYGTQGFYGVGGSAPATPAQLVYWYLLLFNSIPGPLTNGAEISIEIEYHGHFYSLGNMF